MESTKDPIRIVLVDNDEDDQLFFSEALSKIDISYSLKLVSDCMTLLNLIEEGKDCFDIIFLDINMPVMNGKQCLMALKHSDLCKHIPVIIFSISDFEKDIDEVYSLGAHYHIVKPYAGINLVATLKIIFDINWKNPPPVPPKDRFLINFTFSS